jgi:pimeloyl-ACP methyl ester carboxylesterase
LAEIMTKINQHVRLPSGRLLAYHEYGGPDGAPIFYFHGSPSGSLEWDLFGGEELARVGIVSGTAPRLSRLTLRLMGLMARFAPRQVVKGAMATLPAPDQEMLTRPEFQDRFIAMIREALRAGPRGAQWDTALMLGPWDFRLRDVRSAVYLWHGEMDGNAPPAMGRYLAAAIPTCRSCFYTCDDHLSLKVLIA